MDVLDSINIDPRLLEVSTCGHQNDGDWGKRRIPLLFTQELIPSHHRHSEIKQDEARKLLDLTEMVKSVFAICGTGNYIALILKERGEHLTNSRLIIDNQNTHGYSSVR
jgi:hypothetical protein